MTTALEQAQAFLVKASTMAREAVRDAVKGLSDEVRHLYWELRKASFFAPENANLDCRQEHLSPGGKYKLVTTPFSTTNGGWNYTQGLVYTIGSDKPIAEVQRNYSSFPFLFIEGHPNGHDFLVCGADYQGQTVIELDTGKRLDFLPKEAEDGVGFCWSDYEFNPEHLLLIVDGCIWACPYEYRLYDFSDPMSGWPEIEADHMMYASGRLPSIEADGTVKSYELESDEDEDEAKERVVSSIQTFKRDGLKLTRIDEWVSEAEKQSRLDRKESERKWNAWVAEFKSTDPLYLTYSNLVKDPKLSPEDYESHGITHESWCPDFKTQETRWCRRIVQQKDKLTVDLEWGAKTGPVKLVIYQDGKHSENKFFDHSVERMQAAFEHARGLCG
jgi:hypothetical protein